MKPRIFDPSFRYVPSDRTNIRKTFERARREQAAAQKAGSNVKPIKAKKA